MAPQAQDNAHRDETESEAHRLFRAVPGHERKGEHKDDDRRPLNDDDAPIGIKPPGSTGKLLALSKHVTDDGSTNKWANFGQGAPEVGPIPGASDRPTSIPVGDAINEYGPTTGIAELREAVANLYNETYRKGKSSLYTKDNVCIVPGGRAGLTRVASVVGDVFVSFQIPEYTAYDQMLSSFRRLVPIPTVLDKEDAYHLNIDKLEKSVREQGLSVIVASNPRNPTGQVVKGRDLERLVEMARHGTTVILDEFYSWYLYDVEEGSCVSAAEFVDDVNKDPVALIKALGQAGSYLDGGASHPTQVAAIPLLEPSRVQQDRLALQRLFKKKRDYVLDRLEKMGLKVVNKPNSTFYIWLDLSQLPSPLSSGLTFFEELLKEKVIVVPGQFFDLNPSHRRNLFDSPCHSFVRLSFGPEMSEISRGLDGIERLLKRVRKAVEAGQDLHDVIGKDLKTLKE
ncbi:hypothetical protein OIO90_003776 [Microbotryomycetes sp. JL221]|nr:hypothetical protein OIO90_003776 [Microbotryomycetes sp. JL221]